VFNQAGVGLAHQGKTRLTFQTRTSISNEDGEGSCVWQDFARLSFWGSNSRKKENGEGRILRVKRVEKVKGGTSTGGGERILEELGGVQTMGDSEIRPGPNGGKCHGETRSRSWGEMGEGGTGGGGGGGGGYGGLWGGGVGGGGWVWGERFVHYSEKKANPLAASGLEWGKDLQRMLCKNKERGGRDKDPVATGMGRDCRN